MNLKSRFCNKIEISYQLKSSSYFWKNLSKILRENLIWLRKHKNNFLSLTRPVLDQFHDSSIPPWKCAISSESVPKPERVWIIAILQYKCYFSVCRVKNFWACSTNFCRLMMQVLPPFGTSFAALWHEFCHLMAQY